MTWLDNALEQATQPISVDISTLGLDTDTLDVLPLSASEFSALRSHPDISKLKAETERNEALGMRVIYEMLAKCDSDMNWQKFNGLPISLLTQLTQLIMAAVGNIDGGGVVGNS
jgi:hypothetical protein